MEKLGGENELGEGEEDVFIDRRKLTMRSHRSCLCTLGLEVLVKMA